MQKGLQVEKVTQVKHKGCSTIHWLFNFEAEAVFSRISLPALRFQFIADKTLGQQRLVGCPVDSSWGATGANVPYYHLSLHFGLVGPEKI